MGIYTDAEKQSAKALLLIIRGIIDTIREIPDGVPAGTIYAALMAQGCTFDQYQKIEKIVLRSGVVTKRGDLFFKA